MFSLFKGIARLFSASAADHASTTTNTTNNSLQANSSSEEQRPCFEGREYWLRLQSYAQQLGVQLYSMQPAPLQQHVPLPQTPPPPTTTTAQPAISAEDLYLVSRNLNAKPFYDQLLPPEEQESEDEKLDGYLACMISSDSFARKQRLVTNFEYGYLKNLRRWFGSNFHIMPQVSLSALLTINTKVACNLKGWAKGMVANKIHNMTVDFVLVNKTTENIICVIELDDPTHNLAQRQCRDRRIDAVCMATCLPIFHITAQDQIPDLFALVHSLHEPLLDPKMSHLLHNNYHYLQQPEASNSQQSAWHSSLQGQRQAQGQYDAGDRRYRGSYYRQRRYQSNHWSH